MICLDCAAKHPQYKPLNYPAPMQEMPCPVCGGVKLCVANDKIGLPDKFLTVDEAFKLIAWNIIDRDGDDDPELAALIATRRRAVPKDKLTARDIETPGWRDKQVSVEPCDKSAVVSILASGKKGSS